MPAALQVGLNAAIVPVGNDFDCAPAILARLFRENSGKAGGACVREAAGGQRGVTQAAQGNLRGAHRKH